MKKVLFVIFAALLVVSVPGFAWARAVVFFGFGPFFPVPFFYPYTYYPPPAYYYPPPMIEAPPPPPAVPQAQFWYWCNEPQGYYPYVNECPSGWRAVPPQSPR